MNASHSYFWPPWTELPLDGVWTHTRLPSREGGFLRREGELSPTPAGGPRAGLLPGEYSGRRRSAQREGAPGPGNPRCGGGAGQEGVRAAASNRVTSSEQIVSAAPTVASASRSAGV
ncbi:hypothetical protein SAVCW2_22760 [Streptomyces avermitilis]|uniref:Uncharacterized protein n=1 Tax=Streptomyces avermitilis TaxID=33903 RepID=A0A499VVR6_STRAX|nr:hypothetical protein SAVMC3_64000 [Streptomyces avermitilis]GDY83077.1 hypothetical protein SAVCW2_22760 [Streptomyces avermitilis]